MVSFKFFENNFYFLSDAKALIAHSKMRILACDSLQEAAKMAVKVSLNF